MPRTNGAEHGTKFNSVISTGGLGDASADDLRGMLRRHNALEQALAVAAEHGRTAVDALDPLPATAEREALVAAPNLLLQREY